MAVVNTAGVSLSYTSALIFFKRSVTVDYKIAGYLTNVFSTKLWQRADLDRWAFEFKFNANKTSHRFIISFNYDFIVFSKCTVL